MINKEIIQTLTEEWLQGNEYFQYINHIGDTLEVLQADGKKVQGVLKAVDAPSFTITVQEKQKQEGKKRPVLVDVDKTYQMDEVKYAKYLLAFK